MKVFEGRRIDLAGLQKVPGETFRWKGEYKFDLNTRETLYTHLNVFENFHPVIPESYRATPVCLSGQHPTPPCSSRSSIRCARPIWWRPIR